MFFVILMLHTQYYINNLRIFFQLLFTLYQVNFLKNKLNYGHCSHHSTNNCLLNCYSIIYDNFANFHSRDFRDIIQLWTAVTLRDNLKYIYIKPFIYIYIFLHRLCILVYILYSLYASKINIRFFTKIIVLLYIFLALPVGGGTNTPQHYADIITIYVIYFWNTKYCLRYFEMPL